MKIKLNRHDTTRMKRRAKKLEGQLPQPNLRRVSKGDHLAGSTTRDRAAESGWRSRAPSARAATLGIAAERCSLESHNIIMTRKSLSDGIGSGSLALAQVGPDFGDMHVVNIELDVEGRSAGRGGGIDSCIFPQSKGEVNGERIPFSALSNIAKQHWVIGRSVAEQSLGPARVRALAVIGQGDDWMKSWICKNRLDGTFVDTCECIEESRTELVLASCDAAFEEHPVEPSE